MNLRSVVVALFFASLPGLSMAVDAPSGQFRLEQSAIAPGTVLRPGEYSIRVIDHLQDRFLVRVEKKQGASHAVFIAVPTKSLAGHTGLVNWTAAAAQGKAALRGFVFSNGGSALEFVYPKDEAVSLAKANGTPVLAVDPSSEGKSAELAQLSKDDMQIVTLWMLTPTKVDAPAGEATVSASKYQGNETTAPDKEEAKLNRPAILKRLPHTASALPTVLLVGIAAAAGAILLRRRRLPGATV
jgi:hypothetical protein